MSVWTVTDLKAIFSRPFWVSIIKTEQAGVLSTVAIATYEKTLSPGTSAIIEASEHQMAKVTRVQVYNPNGCEVEILPVINDTTKEVIILSNCDLFQHKLKIF